MQNNMNDDFLIHYGVLGMKWGVRHDYPPGSGNYPDGDISDGGKKAKSHAYGSPKADKYASKIDNAFESYKTYGRAETENKNISKEERDRRISEYGAISDKALSDVLKKIDKDSDIPDEYKKKLHERAKWQEKYADAIVRKDDAAISKLDKTAPTMDLKPGGLTDTQKKVLIGAGIAIGVAALGVAIYRNYPAFSAKYLKPTNPIAQELKNPNVKAYWNQVAKNYGNTNAPRIDVSKLGTKDTVFSANTIFQRVDTNGVIFPKGKPYDMAYVSVKDGDNAIYREIYPFFASNKERGSAYKLMKLKASGEVRIPSAKKRFDTFADLWKNNDNFAASVYNDIMGINLKPSEIAEMRADDMLPEAENFYHVFFGTVPKRGAGAGMFMDALKAQGYNGIVDDMDAGRLTDMPLILFGETGLSKVSEEVIEPHWIEDLQPYVRTAGKGVLLHTLNNEGPVLVHYGVLGMKWGVRKDGKPQGYQSSKKARKKQRDKKRAIAKERRKFNSRRSMASDKELDAYISRMQKEKRVRELTASEVNRGQTKVGELFDRYGNQLASAFIGALGGVVISKVLKGR